MRFDLKKVYENPRYKQYLLAPVALFVLSFLLLPGLKFGLELKGGTLVTARFSEQIMPHELEEELSQNLGVLDPGVRGSGEEMIIEFSGNSELLEAWSLISEDDEESLQAAIEKLRMFVGETKYNATGNRTTKQVALEMYGDAQKAFRDRVYSLLLSHGLEEESFSYREIGPALSDIFWSQAQIAFVFAFLAMALIVFIVYRSLVPSFAVIQAAVFDIVFSLGMMSLFGVPLSLPTIAALLMLLGYSVDTDVLLTTRVLKRHGETNAKIEGAMQTGLMMTGTTLTSLVVLFTVTSVAGITTLVQISQVMLFGLFGDLVSTWLGNAVLIKMYVESKKSGL